MWGLVFYLEQELHTFPEHLRSPPVFSGVRVTRSLVLYVCLVDHCLSFCTFSFGHCVVCSSSIYRLWLPLWYLPTFGHCVVCSSSIYGFWLALCYLLTFGHWVVCSSSIYGIWLPLWYIPTFGHCVVCSSIYGFWLPLWYFPTFGHCVVCSSSIYGLWLPLWYLPTFGHCVVFSSSIYGFWLPLWYLRYTDSDYLPLVSSNSSYSLVVKDLYRSVLCFFWNFNQIWRIGSYVTLLES
jgi:predicted nucleic acid-binding Zn ribbon protein